MKRKLIIFIICIVVLVGAVAFISKEEKQDAYNTAFGWSGVKALPAWATDPKIETKGGMFTREFEITFTGTKEQIENWINTEPALKDIQKEDIGNSVYKYILKPQGGAQWAEVKVDSINNIVTIRTYWS